MRVQGSTVLSGCQLGQQRIYVGAKGRQLVVQQDRPAGIEWVRHGFVVIGTSNAFPVPSVFRSVLGSLWQGGDVSELAALKITVEHERLDPDLRRFGTGDKGGDTGFVERVDQGSGGSAH